MTTRSRPNGYGRETCSHAILKEFEAVGLANMEARRDGHVSWVPAHMQEDTTLAVSTGVHPFFHACAEIGHL
eukprot:CAMPEP_0185214236 /NCGR_PEP_ID=MMETSP1140-20130426/68429_1 /TAXON_ID=298111 /ORGANISM="Pavlova sp., Strain CCMP459" /LENGTH=71 /DNA_ID=CAMNT_0027782093 /DNA_START=227 /DNA_END=442 /DNA_ORIENTATION=+